MSEEDLAALLREQGCRMLDMRDQIARMTWQPIETAPKEGAVILLWYENNPIFKPAFRGFVFIGTWGQCRNGRIGWRDPQMRYELGDQATHWMPLPAPPGVK